MNAEYTNGFKLAALDIDASGLDFAKSQAQAFDSPDAETTWFGIGYQTAVNHFDPNIT